MRGWLAWTDMWFSKKNILTILFQVLPADKKYLHPLPRDIEGKTGSNLYS